MFGDRVSDRTRKKLLAAFGENEPQPTSSFTHTTTGEEGTKVPDRIDSTQRPTRTPPYSPLNSGRQEIRILEILPSTWSFDTLPLGLIGDLVCELRTVSLLDDPCYEAISYRWGDQDDTVEITLNGVHVSITRNLSAALRQFRFDARESEQPLRLWADAICINQNDVEERNQQVLLMRQIYSNAANVRIWLGPAYEHDEEMAYAFELLRLIGTEGMVAPDRVKKWFAKPVLGLGKMFQDPYWKRRWITQEIAMAKALTIHFGPINRPFSVEEEVVNIHSLGRKLLDLYVDAQERLMPLFNGRTPEQFEEEPSWTEWVEMFERTRTMQSALTPIMSARSMVKSGKASPLLHHLRGAECSREHDHVYGLLGMVSEDWGIIPNYNASWQDAFADFTAKVMKGMQNLHLLYYAPSSPQLASWSLDWRVELGYLDHPVGDDSMYHAACGSSFSLDILQPGMISLRGLLADTVQATGASTQKNEEWIPSPEEMLEALTNPGRHAILRNWIRLHAEYSLSKTSDKGIPTSLIRTLLADYGNKDPVTIRGMVSNLARRLTVREIHFYKQRIDHFFETGESTHHICFELVNRMTKYAFFMTKGGRSGMCKPGVRAGDRICIFSSCDIPYCVREMQRSGRIVYKIISPCYVDGIMDGEAVLSAMAVAETCGIGCGVEDVFDGFTLI